MSATIDPWLARMDYEFDRIMKMTDAELEAEERAAGRDPQEEARKCREQIMALIEQVRRRQKR